MGQTLPHLRRRQTTDNYFLLKTEKGSTVSAQQSYEEYTEKAESFFLQAPSQAMSAQSHDNRHCYYPAASCRINHLQAALEFLLTTEVGSETCVISENVIFVFQERLSAPQFRSYQ
jgi:hypothetical protein